MSVSLNTPGAIAFRSSGTGTNANTLTLNAPTSLAQATNVTIRDPGGDASLVLTPAALGTAIAATRTLTAADNNKLFVCSQVGAADVIASLPVAAGGAFVGWKARFYLGTAVANAGAHFTVRCATASSARGNVYDINSGVGGTGTNAACRFVGNVAIVGDWMEAECLNATAASELYLFRGGSGANAGILFIA